MPRLLHDPIPDFVPSRHEVFEMLLSLLPRGRAWQTHDSAITSTVIDPATGVVLKTIPGSVLRSLWYALSGPWHTLEVAVGAALQEYACGTSNVNRDAWIEEFDTGERCDPYDNDVCAKATDVGGHSFAYYRDLVAKAGWVIEGGWTNHIPSANENTRGDTLVVRVVSMQSTSMPVRYRVKEKRVTLPKDWRVNALVSTVRLQCMLERIVPAHSPIVYEVI